MPGAQVREIENGLLPGEGFEREGIDRSTACDLVQGSIEMGAGVGSHVELLHAPAIGRMVRRSRQMDRRMHVAIRAAIEEGLGEIEEAHGEAMTNDEFPNDEEDSLQPRIGSRF